MDVITTTIDREWFVKSVAGTQRNEYRQILAASVANSTQ